MIVSMSIRFGLIRTTRADDSIITVCIHPYNELPHVPVRLSLTVDIHHSKMSVCFHSPQMDEILLAWLNSEHLGVFSFL